MTGRCSASAISDEVVQRMHDVDALVSFRSDGRVELEVRRDRDGLRVQCSAFGFDAAWREAEGLLKR